MQTIEEEVDTSKTLDASLVDMESSGTKSKEQNTSSRSGNDAHDDDADIRPIYDEEPMAKEREAASTKPHHMITSSNSRISSKNMPRFSSNDMVHNHYLERAKKKTQEHSRNSEPSLMPSARSQSTANGSKPKPRSNTQTSRNWPTSKSSFATTKIVPIAKYPRNSRNFSDSKHFVCSICQKCVFIANHDSYVTKSLKEVNSRAKVQSNKTTTRNKPVEQISVAKKPERQIPKVQVGLRWVSTGKIFNSSTTKVDSEPSNGSNADITNQYECKQTLDDSGFKEFSTDEQGMTSDHNSSELGLHDHSNEQSTSKLVPKFIPSADKTNTSRQKLEFIFYHHITMLSDPVDTSMVEKSKLDEDTQGKAVDLTHYHGMVGTLMYLTAGRPNLTFVVCMCARYQAKPIKKHLHAIKRIFKYLRGTVNRGLWYPKDSSIALTAYADADYAGCQDTRQSTSGSMQLLGDILYQLADIFTKALGRERIEFLINKLGMRSFKPETLKKLADEADE
nr:uncharacterized mitochondrial protein AtMg00810-like [Tanacetum cinerariifolium]